MTLLCRPRGRGNWRIIEVGVSLDPDLFTVRLGMTLTLGTLVLRVVEIRV